jgi:hypothetical protein
MVGASLPTTAFSERFACTGQPKKQPTTRTTTTTTTRAWPAPWRSARSITSSSCHRRGLRLEEARLGNPFSGIHQSSSSSSSFFVLGRFSDGWSKPPDNCILREVCLYQLTQETADDENDDDDEDD